MFKEGIIMDFCINSEELRKALKEIESAEKNGFKFCLAVFRMTNVGFCIENCQASYSDMIEKAHPTDGSLNWGRFQIVSKRNKFVKGKLVPIKNKK